MLPRRRTSKLPRPKNDDQSEAFSDAHWSIVAQATEVSVCAAPAIAASTARAGYRHLFGALLPKVSDMPKCVVLDHHCQR